MSEELDRLRAELDEIDRKLVEQLAARLSLVARVKQAKRASGVHAFDRAREREVFEMAEARGAELGLPASLVREVMGALLEASHNIQEDDADDMPALERRRFLLVGGRGRMGRLFAGLLERRGHPIDVLEKGDAVEPARVAAADVVMVAVPMTEAAQVVGELAPLVRRDALVCDINSLKGEVCGALASSAGEALGTHPMFGPTVRTLRRQKIVVCRVKPGKISAWLEAELGRMGAELVESDPQTHDRMMGVVQVLTHFGIMVMGRALTHSGLSLGETLRFMSPIYRLEVSMVGRLFSQAAELYREILMSNPHGAAFRELFVAQAGELADIVARGDVEAFMTSFRETSEFFAGFSAEAMALTDQMIETLISRP
jgi:chorismate mutase/prephenate dehydrogenase